MFGATSSRAKLDVYTTPVASAPSGEKRRVAMRPRRRPAAARYCNGRTKSAPCSPPACCAANAAAERSCPKAIRIQASGAMTIAAIRVARCRIEAP